MIATADEEALCCSEQLRHVAASVPELPRLCQLTMGNCAASQAAMPPAISLTALKPCCCSKLAAIDER